MKHVLPTGTLLSVAAAMLTATSTQAALVVPAGNSLVVNDTDLNISWTQDASLIASQADGYAGGAAAFVTAVINSVPGAKIKDTTNSGYHSLSTADFDALSGGMTWFGAKAWADYYLNSVSYGGVTGWRLPTSNAVFGYDSGSELGHLFFTELGGTAGKSITTTHANMANYNLFSNIQNYLYWSGTEYHGLIPDGAWVFHTGSGDQGVGRTNAWFAGWAVRSGEVAAVSTPGAFWLMVSAVIGLSGGYRAWYGERSSTLDVG